MRLGARASYALTPAFTLRTAVTANWTAEEVDTNSTLTNAAGLLPGDCTVRASAGAGGTCRDQGDARYLGTELNVGFQWRFAPNVAFDLVGAYMWSGEALATHLTTGNTGGARNGRNPQDVQSIAARMRYSW
jgi:long-subunit fatty acid transport protein